MAPLRQTSTIQSDQSARDTAFCSAIVEPGKQGRFKSLLDRDSRKVVCQLKSPILGLDLLQIAVLLDDVATVEQLIALGADMRVTLSQEEALKWPSDYMPCPCTLSERGEHHWISKARHLGVLQSRIEAVSGTAFSLIHLAVLAYSTKLVRLLISKGHSDANERAAATGLTPIVCAALCKSGFVADRNAWEPMRGMVDLLLELGGDLSATDMLGNDFVAIAACAYKDGMWNDIIKDASLLAKCNNKHAGRTALQLLHCFITEPREAPGRLSKWWSEQMLALAHVWMPDGAWKDLIGEQWQNFRRELSEPISQSILPPFASEDDFFLCLRDSSCDDDTEPDQIVTNIWYNIMQGVAVLPCSMGLTKEAPKALMQMLDALGVVPECLRYHGSLAVHTADCAQEKACSL